MAQRPAGARSDRDAGRCHERHLSAFLVEEEGTDSTFRALAEVFGQHGLPLSLYTDRGTIIFTRRRLAERSTGRARRKSAGRWIIWVSNISRPIRPRRAAVWNACSRPCRIG